MKAERYHREFHIYIAPASLGTGCFGVVIATDDEPTGKIAFRDCNPRGRRNAFTNN
jgi:hypothetical protein